MKTQYSLQVGASTPQVCIYSIYYSTSLQLFTGKFFSDKYWPALHSITASYLYCFMQVHVFQFPPGVTAVSVQANARSKRCAILSVQNVSVSQLNLCVSANVYMYIIQP